MIINHADRTDRTWVCKKVGAGETKLRGGPSVLTLLTAHARRWFYLLDRGWFVALLEWGEGGPSEDISSFVLRNHFREFFIMTGFHEMKFSPFGII
jgi:hypothetical protein